MVIAAECQSKNETKIEFSPIRLIGQNAQRMSKRVMIGKSLLPICNQGALQQYQFSKLVFVRGKVG